MAITEKSRSELRTYLEDTMGEERATTLMEHLPPVGWADVATRQDVEQLRAATRQDVEQLRAATRQDLDQLRAATRQDLNQLRAATRQDLDQLRAATRQDADQLRRDVEQLRRDTKKDMEHLREMMDARFDNVATQAQLTELHRDLRSQTLAFMALSLTLFGLVVTVLKLA